MRPPSSCLFNHQPVLKDLHSLLGLILLSAWINSIFQNLCMFPTCSLLFPAYEEERWKSRKSLACAFPGAPLLQALGSDSALRVCPSPLLPSCKRSLSCERQGCVSCERTGGAQRRGCRRKFTTALRAVSVGYWKWFEHQMQYWKCCSKRSG